MKTIINEYEQQAIKFLEDTKTKIQINYMGDIINKNWGEDTPRRAYNVTISNERHIYNFTFWDSLHNTDINNMTFEQYCNKYYDYRGRSTRQKEFYKLKKEATPKNYDILACFGAYDTGTFEDFCNDFGYDTDSRKALDTYLVVQDEYNNLCKLFTQEQLEMLQEIN